MSVSVSVCACTHRGTVHREAKHLMSATTTKNRIFKQEATFVHIKTKTNNYHRYYYSKRNHVTHILNRLIARRITKIST